MAAKKTSSTSTGKKASRSLSSRASGKAARTSSASGLAKAGKAKPAKSKGAKKAAAAALTQAPAKRPARSRPAKKASSALAQSPAKKPAKKASRSPSQTAGRSGAFAPTVARESRLPPAPPRDARVAKVQAQVEQLGRPLVPAMPDLVVPTMRPEQLRAIQRMVAQSHNIAPPDEQLQATLRKTAELTARILKVDALRDLGRFLAGATEATLSVGQRSVALPADLLVALARMAETLGRGSDLMLVEPTEPEAQQDVGVPQVTVLDLDQELSSQQAADLLNVSRPHVVKLATTGAIPFRKVGNRHRFSLGDVLAYDEQARVTRDEALRAIAPEGGYTAEDF